MKLRRGIQWVKTIEEQPNTEKSISQRVLADLPEVALSVFFAFLFMMTAMRAITDVYEVESPGISLLLLYALILFILGMIQVILPCLVKVHKKIVTAGGFLCICAGFGVYFWKVQWTQELPGNVYFALLCVFFVVLWFARMLHRNELLAVPPAVIIVIELWGGNVPGKVTWFLLLAGILLCSGRHWERADMQISSLHRNPEGENRQSFVWLIGGLLISMLCGLLLLLGTGPAQKIVEENAKGVVSLVSGVTGKVSGWEIWEKLDLPVSMNAMMTHMLRDEALDYEVLSNDIPQYKQVEVLQVEINQEPTDNIYLRGFCGDIYVDGVWQRDWERLEVTSKEDEREYDAVRAQIAFSTVRKLQGQTNTGGTTQNPNMRQIRVHYTGMVSEQVYIPYFAMVTTKGIGLIGDSGFTKEKKVTEVNFDQWEVSQETLPEITSEKSAWDIWYEGYVEEHYLQVPEEFTGVKAIAIQIETAREAEAIRGTEGTESPGDMEWQGMLDAEEVLGVSSENHIRLAKAQAVAEWLAQNTTYNLNTPALPEGTDPIVYFLETSKTGYCMHYAGAAVMLLREMGVPARYASGYMVEADAFNEQKTGNMSAGQSEEADAGSFMASVLDDRAHAWVEVYLDTIGWVPVEVTKGYPAIETSNDLALKLQVADSTDNIVTGGSPKGEDAQASTGSGTSGVIVQTGESRAEDADAEESAENSTDISDGTDNKGPVTDGEKDPAENEELEDAGEASEEPLNPAEGEETEGDSGVSEEEEVAESAPEDTDEKKIVMITPPPVEEEAVIADTKAVTRKIIICILCVFIVVGVLVALVADTHKFFRRESTYYKQLRKEMKRGNHKRVILLINSGVYRKLHFKQLLAVGGGDEAYAKALKDNYKELSEEEWDRYMAIVKAVAFSEADFTEEDVKFCFDVYRDVIYKDEVW